MGTLLFTGFCFTVKPSQGDHRPQNRSHIIGLWLKYWVSTNSWVGWGRNIFLSFIYSIGSIWYLTLDQSIPNIWTRIVFSFNISWQRSCNVFCYWLQAFTPGKDLANVDKYRKRKKKLWSSTENGWDERPFFARPCWWCVIPWNQRSFSYCILWSWGLFSLPSNNDIKRQNKYEELELVHTYILFKL